ncbi:MAG: twin-arginine translocase subunit TatB, partial [Thiotrichales bacterium]|nr:twin-arginine translocase subunit TatB [Thiotrichales bacterium]
MFAIGFWELVLIGIVILFSIRPDRLPGFARETGAWLARARRLIYSARRELQNEFNLYEQQDLKASINDMDELMKNAPDRNT